MDRKTFIASLAHDADLVQVASALGLHVLPQRGQVARTLCPFHEDRDPSLALYVGGRQESPHYHCFGCGEHGNVFQLVKRVKDTHFRGALEWLAEFMGRRLPPARRGAVQEPRRRGVELAYEVYRRAGAKTRDRLAEWAEQRGLSVHVLDDAGVVVAEPLTLQAEWLRPQQGDVDPEALDSLVEARLLVPLARTGHRPRSGWLPFQLYTDFFRDRRILIPLRDENGNLEGLAGRALEGPDGTSSGPKYLYTPGLRKSQLLFGADRLQREIRTPRRRQKPGGGLDVFLVEGPVDALRMATVGQHALAALGSRLSVAQTTLVGELAREAVRHRRSVLLHVFLDADDAGRSGTTVALRQLLGAALEAGDLRLDVIVPPEGEPGKDPDELLRGLEPGPALTRVAGWAVSPLAALAASLLQVPPDEGSLTRAWKRATPATRYGVGRELSWLAPRHEPRWWSRVIDTAEASSTWLDAPDASSAERASPAWAVELQATLRRLEGTLDAADRGAPADHVLPLPSREEQGYLLLAAQLAERSGRRREVPDDPGSWERIQLARDAVLPVLCDMLGEGDGRRWFEPLRATLTPKDTGGARRKAMPCPEDAILQQYMLSELLRERGRERFARHIPAVRHYRSRAERQRITTGRRDRAGVLVPPARAETVSFAYQVEMEALEGTADPPREGMFRPYYECWRAYINYLLSRVQRCPYGRLYAARLDVRSFYDTLPRHAVVNELGRAVRDALAAGFSDPADFAPLFLPREERSRAGAFVDWLCDQSFHYPFLGYGDGSIRFSEDPLRGVPQGPDLSAYLANASLFALDRRLADAVAVLDEEARRQHGPDSAVGGAYARYVDDIVIFASTPEDRRRLSLLVEEGLSRVGLELSAEKSDPLPAMSPRRLHRFLMQDRSFGRAPYGAGGAPPVVVPLSQWSDPLANAGDRSEALVHLHDPTLDDPSMGQRELLGRLRHALRAAGLRHNDRVQAARHLWRVAAGAEGTEQVASVFIELWEQLPEPPLLPVDSPEDEEVAALRSISPLLLWLEGLERCLSVRQDANPTLTEDQRRQWQQLRQGLAAAVNHGLCDVLRTRCAGGAPGVDLSSLLARFDHMLRLRTLAIEWTAARTDQRGAAAAEPGPGPSGPALVRSWISRAVQRRRPEDLPRAVLDDWRASEDLLRHGQHFVLEGYWLHLAISHLQLHVAGCRPKLGGDPLAGLATPVSQAAYAAEEAPSVGGGILATVRSWLPDSAAGGDLEEEADDTEAASRRVAAAVAFLNLVRGAEAVDLAAQRPGLLRSLAEVGDDQQRWEPLATPPGVPARGVFLRRIDDGPLVSVLRFLDLRPDEGALETTERLTPLGVWSRPRPVHSAAGDVVASWFELTVPQPAPLTEPLDGPASLGDFADRVLGSLAWLVTAHECLASKALAEAHDGLICPITPLTLLGPSPSDGLGERPGWTPIGYRVRPSAIRGQAWVGRGTRQLADRGVQEQHGDFWRVGVALADLLGEVGIADQGARSRLTAPPLVADEDESTRDWAGRSLMRLAVYRLCGANQPEGTLKCDAAGRPRAAARALACVGDYLETARPGGAEVEALRPVVALLAESRALQVRRQSTLPLDAEGAAVRLLAEIACAAFSFDESLAARLPQPDRDLANAGPRRGASRAWWRLALRVTALSSSETAAHAQPKINGMLSGLVTLALASETRALALEQWGRLDHEERSRVVDAWQGPGAWGIDDRALLVISDDPGREGDDALAPATTLLGLLDEATLSESLDLDRLEEVTPLGWAVVLGLLTGALPAAKHGRAPKGRGQDMGMHLSDDSAGRPFDVAAEGLRALARTFATTPLSPEPPPGDREGAAVDCPWGDLGRPINALGLRAAVSHFQSLQGLELWLGVEVRPIVTDMYPLRRSRSGMVGEVEVRTGYEGRVRVLESWRIMQGALSATDDSGFAQERDGGLVRYLWTESWLGDALLGVSLCRPGLYALAGPDPSAGEGGDSRGDR